LTTQAKFGWEKPKSFWIAGRATFTIVASRMIISIPADSTTRASQREGRGPSSAAGVRVFIAVTGSSGGLRDCA
jgi:hypothetical protein